MTDGDTIHPELPFGPEKTVVEEDPMARVERLKQELLEAVAASDIDTLERRVAWLLNVDPKTRDSDVTLQLRYWEQFESDIYNGTSVTPDDLYKLARLTSLTRARQKIQNSYHLFQASPEVKAKRGMLRDDEKERAASAGPPPQGIVVYADESGKTHQQLVVGSVWVLDPFESVHIAKALERRRKEHGFEGELHFKKINVGNVAFYRTATSSMLDAASSLSFKVITLQRKGLGNTQEALQQLFYFLLRRGVEHEHGTGRAELPRALSLYKDAEEKGFDDLLLAGVKERLAAANAAAFGSKLRLDAFVAMPSDKVPLLQLADLFTSSVARRLNRERTSEHPKDAYADWLCHLVGADRSADDLEFEGDMAARLLV